MNASPNYGPWVYYPAAGYWARNCNYFDNNLPNHFFMIFHPGYPQFYYCYYPTSANTGYYWCRCYSPNSPEYNPFKFSVINSAADLMYHTIEAASPHFQPFYLQANSPMPAHYQPSSQVVMEPLPPGLPPG